MNRVAVTAIALSAMTAPVMAEPPTDPFGFRFGSSISDYQCEPSGIETGGHICKAPRPHPDLDRYYVFAMPNIGVCDVWSVSHYDTVDRATAKVEKLRDQLGERFQLAFRRTSNSRHVRYRDASTYDGYEISVTLSNKDDIWSASVLMASPLAVKCKKAAATQESGTF